MNNSHALKSVYKCYNLFYNPSRLSFPHSSSFEEIIGCAIRVAAKKSKNSFSRRDHLWLQRLDPALTSRYIAVPAYCDRS